MQSMQIELTRPLWLRELSSTFLREVFCCYLFLFVVFRSSPKVSRAFSWRCVQDSLVGRAQGTIYGTGDWSQVGFIKRQLLREFESAAIEHVCVCPFLLLCLKSLSCCTIFDWRQFKGDMLFIVVIIGEGCCWDVAALPVHNRTPVTTVVWAASPHIRAQPGSQTEVSLSCQAHQHCPAEGDVTFSLNLSTEPHPVLASRLPFLLVRSIVNLLSQVT